MGSNGALAVAVCVLLAAGRPVELVRVVVGETGEPALSKEGDSAAVKGQGRGVGSSAMGWGAVLLGGDHAAGRGTCGHRRDGLFIT